jgi:hypothetical protein
MALKSGVTAEDHRFGLQADIASAGALRARTGLFPNGSNPANLVAVSGLVATVSPFQAFVAGTSAATQAGYRVTCDDPVTLTFDAGSGTNPRIDLVVVRVRDDPYDGSGFQAGTVEIIFGVPAVSPTVPSVPESCLPLWQVPVPANASGGNPINFAGTRVDRRIYTTASGGLIPIASQTERDGVVAPYSGMSVWRADQNWAETYDGTAWRVQGVPAVTNYAALSLITDPLPGMVAITTSDNIPWMYTTLAGPGMWISPLQAIFPTGYAAWAPWTPVLAQDSVVAATVTSAGYQAVGKMIVARGVLTVTGVGTAAKEITITLPAPSAGTYALNGSILLHDLSAGTWYAGVMVAANANNARAVGNGATGYLGAAGSTFTLALAAGDTVSFTVTYEAA